MGNVPLHSQGGGELTEFQKNKLTFDFNTFFDLNHDGFLSYKVSTISYTESSQPFYNSYISGFLVGQGQNLPDVWLEDEQLEVQEDGGVVHQDLEQPGVRG